jgi:hypothetical protein
LGIDDVRRYHAPKPLSGTSANTSNANIGDFAMNESAERAVIVDVRIPFVRLVLFFIKAALAAIPAAIVVGFLLMLATALVAALLGHGSFVMMRQ